MSPLPSLYLETIQRASYIIVQRYSNIQSEATGPYTPPAKNVCAERIPANTYNSNDKVVSLHTI